MAIKIICDIISVYSDERFVGSYNLLLSLLLSFLTSLRFCLSTSLVKDVLLFIIDYAVIN